MQSQEFLKPRLIGDRFEAHTIPLEVLKDFAALQEMLVETAKWRFLQDHPDRERVQRNFGKDIELHLAGIEDGSAKLAIVLAFSALFAPFNAKYFEQARTEIVNAVALSEQGRPPKLPTYLLGYFDRVGRSLRAGESIEFPGEHGSAVTLNSEVRKRLILASKIESWTEETAVRGRVSEVDLAHNSFEFELSDGTRTKAPLDDTYRSDILEALKGYRDGVNVLIQGVVRRDRMDRLKGFESIEYVTPLDPLDTTLRLEQIATLREGWLNGKGAAFSRERLEWLTSAFESAFDAELPLPYLYPTAEGGIQAEWNLHDWSVSLEIDLGTRMGDFQALHLQDQRCSERQLNLAEADGWKQLNQELKLLENAPAEASQSES